MKIIFNKFLNVFNFTQKKIEEEKKKEKNKIEEQIDFLIKSENISIFCNFLESGYLLNDNQKLMIINNFKFFIKENRNYVHKDIILQSLKKDQPFLEDLFIENQKDFLINFREILRKMDKEYKYNSASKVEELYSTIVKPTKIRLDLLIEFSLFELSKEKIQESISISQESKKLLEDNTFWNENLLKVIKESENKILIKLNEKYNQYFEKNLEQELQKTKLLYSDLKNNINKKVDERIKDKVINLGPQVIPKESWSYFQQTEKIISQINIDKLPVDKKWEIENIINKKLPEMLEDYLSISDNYKTKLKTTDGKTANDLLLDSLKEINNFAKDVFENQQEDNFINLSVKNKYFKQK